MSDTIYLSWKDVNLFASNLARQINIEFKNIPKPKIVTFTKGGTWTSSLIANYLDWKPTIYSLSNPFPEFCALYMDKSNKDFIVIDDVLESGQTIEPLKHFPILSYWFLVKKEGVLNQYTPESDLYNDNWNAGQLISASKWVEFPWEKLK